MEKILTQVTPPLARMARNRSPSAVTALREAAAEEGEVAMTVVAAAVIGRAGAGGPAPKTKTPLPRRCAGVLSATDPIASLKGP